MSQKEELRHNINYNIEGKEPCNICNPQYACSDDRSKICEECMAWLLKPEPKK